MQHKYKIAIIIPYFEGDRFFNPCVESIKNQENYPLEYILIYIIDNSYNPSKKAKDYKKLTNYKYIRSKPFIGFGRACNLGMTIAKNDNPDFYLILNQDTILSNLMIFELIKTYQIDKKTKILSPFIYDYGTNQPSEMVLKSFLFENETFYNDYIGKSLSETYVIKSIGAVCLLIPSNVFLNYPIFDPVFFMYNEDMDFYRRLNTRMINLCLSTKSKIQHYSGMRRAKENIVFSKFKNYHNKNSQIFFSIRYECNIVNTVILIFVFFKRDIFQFGLFYAINTSFKRIYLSIKKYNYLRYNSNIEIRKKIKKFIEKDKLS